MIRLMIPDLAPADIEAAVGVLRTGQLVQGDQVREFEGLLAEIIGVENVIVVGSGTAALLLSLKALGVGPGDAVAVPAYTWPATANVVVLLGAEPVFVDVEPDSLGMDPGVLAAACRSDPRIKAVMPVHPFGRMVDMDAIAGVAREHKAIIVEDAACALGAKLKGRAAGAWGRTGCVSFHPRKVVTTGEGGAIATDDPHLARHVRMLRNHGLDPSVDHPDFAVAGYNCRLTEFQAALGIGQLRRLDRILAQRRELAMAYDSCFRGTDIEPVLGTEPGSHTYQSYVVLLPRQAGVVRDDVLASLRARGIEATIGTHHVPRTGYYSRRYGYSPGDFPVTDDVAARAVTLPLHHVLNRDAVRLVANALLETVNLHLVSAVQARGKS